MSKLLMLVPVLLIACEYNEQFITTSPVDSKIIIETQELLVPDAKNVAFHCRTEKSYPCSNYPLLTEEKSTKIPFG
jgi:hypothetical protein